MLALSDSSTSSDWSASTLSPLLTRISITLAPASEPRSGTLTAWLLLAAFFGAALGSGFFSCGASLPFGSSCFGCFSLAGLSSDSGCLSLSPLATSSSISESPSFRLSPSLVLMDLTTPPLGEGTSMLALSDSSTISDCSASTVSPSLTRISITSPSPPPMSGTLMSSLIPSLLSSPVG